MPLVRLFNLHQNIFVPVLFHLFIPVNIFACGQASHSAIGRRRCQLTYGLCPAVPCRKNTVVCCLTIFLSPNIAALIQFNQRFERLVIRHLPNGYKKAGHGNLPAFPGLCILYTDPPDTSVTDDVRHHRIQNEFDIFFFAETFHKPLLTPEFIPSMDQINLFTVSA